MHLVAFPVNFPCASAFGVISHSHIATALGLASTLLCFAWDRISGMNGNGDGHAWSHSMDCESVELSMNRSRN